MAKEIRIANKLIGEKQPVFIIAEAGVNHNGRVKLAKKLVDAAKAAGADAIKFQTFKAEELATPQAPKAVYQKRHGQGRTQYEMLKALELSAAEFRGLLQYCQKKKIVFLSTPFDPHSAHFLQQLGIPAFKISSGDLTNLPLLAQIAKYGKPVILSTGMATLLDVRLAVRAIYRAGNKKLVLLHCTSNYPTRAEDVNLKAMLTLKEKFGLPVGYSDHSLGLEVPTAAVAMGACVIEKHITLNKKATGPDHRSSLTPAELKKLVQAIRRTEVMFGNGLKEPQASEKETKKVARKSLVSATEINKGKLITRGMLAVKRPGTGIAPKYLSYFIGKLAKRNMTRDKLIKWDLV